MLLNKRTLFVYAACALTLLSSCSKPKSNETLLTNAFVCSILSVSRTATNQATISLKGTNGTAPYVLSSITVGGQNVSSISGSQTFTGSTSLVATFSSIASAGATGTAVIRDSASSVASSACSFTVPATTASNALNCLISPSTTSPTVNQTVTFNMSVVSGGTSPYTFSSFSPGTNGVTSSGLINTSTGASAQAYYTTAGTSIPVVSVTDVNGITGNCSTNVTVQGSSTGGSLGCTVGHVVTGASAKLTVTASTGEAVTLSQINTTGTITSSGNPTTVAYTSPGLKSVTLYAASAVTGIPCNAGAQLSDSFTIVMPVCTATINPNPSYAGSYVTASATYSSVGSGNPRIANINYPLSSYMSGYFTGSNTALLYFPYAGYWNITFVVEDSAGTRNTCSRTQTVYY